MRVLAQLGRDAFAKRATRPKPANNTILPPYGTYPVVGLVSSAQSELIIEELKRNQMHVTVTNEYQEYLTSQVHY